MAYFSDHIFQSRKKLNFLLAPIEHGWIAQTLKELTLIEDFIEHETLL
jgi:hypothetical protein